jgi:hypothetical protein
VTVTVAVVNSHIGTERGFGVYVKYNKNQLPRFVQWKQMGEQDYVVGLEPCNCGVEGRRVDEEQGLLQVLEAGETREFDLEFGPLTTLEEVASVRSRAAGITPRLVSSYKDFVRKVR